MKSYSARSGNFNKRPYYDLKDVERMCVAELRMIGLCPEKPAPIRIDRFLEKRFGSAIVRYDTVPAGILGYTIFGPKGVQRIVIDRSLDEDGSAMAERRIRTTMAHEGGHGLLHVHLFGPNSEPLFGDFTDPDKPKIMCRDELKAGHSSYNGNWWEYQANMAMGILLLPHHLVEMALEPFFVPCGLLGIGRLDDSHRDEAVRTLAETFNVNPVVARYRLNELYPVNSGAQLML